MEERQGDPGHREEGSILCTLRTKGWQGLPHERRQDPSPIYAQELEPTLQGLCPKSGAVGQGGSLDERRGREDKASKGSNKRLPAALTRNLRKTFKSDEIAATSIASSVEPTGSNCQPVVQIPSQGQHQQQRRKDVGFRRNRSGL